MIEFLTHNLQKKIHTHAFHAHRCMFTDFAVTFGTQETTKHTKEKVDIHEMPKHNVEHIPWWFFIHSQQNSQLLTKILRD